MNPERNRLYAGSAIGLVLAALAGFGVARMTGPSAPTAEPETAADAAPTDTVVITQDGINTSGIGLAQAATGSVAGLLLASATVAAPTDAQPVPRAREGGPAPATLPRIAYPDRAAEQLGQ